jgi:hypothetical protein
MGIWISVQAEEVNLWLMRVFVHSRGSLLMTCKRQARAISILIGV